MGSPANAALIRQKELPPASLRGYGQVNATLWSSGESAAGTALEIVCEDEAHARLTQSKYLSDIALLPGVKTLEITPAAFPHPLSVREVEGQGLVAALRFGHRVFIIAAPDRGSFERILPQLPGASPETIASSLAEVEVPMWLDRWDRFGFRFYYRPWETPEGKDTATYDFAGEFGFAEKNDRAGFMFWATRSYIDTAEGLGNEVWWDWARQAARARKLPVGLNIMTGGNGGSWFLNRYRDQTSRSMPQFTGNYHRVADPMLGGTGVLSWSATTGMDAELGFLQQIVRRMADEPNLTSVLEPHGELRHGPHDIFLEYGPVADASFRVYLEERYKTVSALNQAWGSDFPSWEEVKVPEVASFLGWGPQALDLAGAWRVGHEPIPGEVPPLGILRNFHNKKIETGSPTPAEWFSATFDDTSWPVVTAPGHDRTMLLPQRPAVYRRTIDVPAQWLAGHDRVWLYLWDLNLGANDTVEVAINGKLKGKSIVKHAVPHWGALEVTGALQPGANQISLRLPKGFLGYRVYLSPDEPLQYPALGRHGNTRWVDFRDWIGWSRVRATRRGMEMIRQAAPNQPITLMAPDGYADGLRQLAVRYGGNFHNTGYMAEFWADYLPSIMRGARLPFSLEPGGPAKNLTRFKQHLGRYATEGIQGIDYFIHIGAIMWPDDIREHFEKNLPVIKLIGKYHAPDARVAALYSTRVTDLTGYPWGQDLNTNLSSGYWNWNLRGLLRDRYESDGLTESSFADGSAARYKVIFDSNTSIMDEALLAGIERYVRDGGTFVTFAQSGRHTPDEPDTWPISRLTGYRVTHIDTLSREGHPLTSRTLRAAPGQTVFGSDMAILATGIKANGLTLEKVAADTQDLMLWEDGPVAIGMRKLGKGSIIQVGARFTGPKIADRIEPRTSTNRPTHDSRPAELSATAELLTRILQSLDVAPRQADWLPENDNVLLRHYVSNNGLYDVWTVWNQSGSHSAEGNITLRNPGHVPFARDIIGSDPVPVREGRFPVTLAPLQTRVFLTPRNAIADAPLAWFRLQRDWWRSPVAFTPRELPVPKARFSSDLSAGWSFKPLEEGESVTPLLGAGVDDSGWERMDLGTWGLPGQPSAKRALLRKTFTVPAHWTNGEASLWLQSWNSKTFVERGRVWLDGEPVTGMGGNGLVDANPGGVLKPGTSHTLAVEVEGRGRLVGSRGSAWLWLWREPEKRIDLAGEWTPSPDAMRYESPIRLPGEYDAMTLRRNVEVPAAFAGHRAVVRVNATGRLVGVLVNGKWVRRFHHFIGERFDIDVTPWIQFGETNEIEIASMDAPAKGEVRSVSLDFHAVTGTGNDYP